MNIYLVTAYRWGNTNLDQYQVYCGPDRTKAVALAQAETSDRGGKYGCAVYEWDEDGTDCKRIAYFGGMMHGEDEPFHNWRIDYFQSLGHVLDGYASGKMLLPDPAREGKVLKFAEVDKPPQFILDEVARHTRTYETMTRLDAERRQRDHQK